MEEGSEGGGKEGTEEGEEEEEEEEESESDDDDDVQITIGEIKTVPVAYARTPSYPRMSITPGGEKHPCTISGVLPFHSTSVTRLCYHCVTTM